MGFLGSFVCKKKSAAKEVTSPTLYRPVSSAVAAQTPPAPGWGGAPSTGGQPLPLGREPREGAHCQTPCLGTGEVGLGGAWSLLCLINRSEENSPKGVSDAAVSGKQAGLPPTGGISSPICCRRSLQRVPSKNGPPVGHLSASPSLGSLLTVLL